MKMPRRTRLVCHIRFCASGLAGSFFATVNHWLPQRGLYRSWNLQAIGQRVRTSHRDAGQMIEDGSRPQRRVAYRHDPTVQPSSATAAPEQGFTCGPARGMVQTVCWQVVLGRQPGMIRNMIDARGFAKRPLSRVFHRHLHELPKPGAEPGRPPTRPDTRLDDGVGQLGDQQAFPCRGFSS